MTVDLPPASHTTPLNTTPSITTLGKGLTKEFLYDERIVVWTLDTVDRDILDIGADDVWNTLATWRKEHPYLAIYDITSAKIALTPHLRSHLERLSKSFPELSGRSAVVLPRSVVTQVFKLFVRALNREGRRKQVFFTRDAAIDWLKQMMIDL